MFEDIFGILNYRDSNIYILKHREIPSEDYGLTWHKYRFDNKATNVSVKTFVENYYKGELKEYIKSSNPPTTNTGNLKVAVQRTFDQFAKDKHRHCVMVFYSSNPRYCFEDFCVKALGVMEKLAAYYNEQEREDIWFSKMDGLTDENIGISLFSNGQILRLICSLRLWGSRPVLTGRLSDTTVI